ncbi:MAG: hypothetical protein NXI32_30515 [bacterium]|nr:hypothetical protein [bacterium]
MLIVEGRKFVLKPFDSEEELERVVVENAEYLFGPASIYFPKSLIATRDGTGTIPDGYVLDLARRVWYVVEAEISKHSVWSHIAPQVAKQIIAASNPVSKQSLVDIAADRVRNDPDLQERFADEGIHAIDIRRVLAEILAKEPIVAMPIDAVKDDLKEWAATLRIPVKLWIVRKYVEFGRPEIVMYEIPEEFGPIVDTAQNEEDSKIELARYGVTVADLIDADLLHAGQTLHMPYKPRNGEQRDYRATICEDGSIELLGKQFSSPSYAAVYGIQDAGSDRKTVNGWTAWRLENGENLASIREKYLSQE